MAAAHGAHLRDPDAIYRASFAAIRREAPIDRLPADLQALALRLIHSCGMPDILDDLAWTPDAVAAGRAALAAGAPVLVDATMVAAGIRRECLPAGNQVLCTLGDPRVAALAARAGDHPLGRRGRAVAGPAGGRRGRARQRADRAVPPARAARGRRAAARAGAGLPGRLHRRGRGQGGADRPSPRPALRRPCAAGAAAARSRRPRSTRSARRRHESSRARAGRRRRALARRDRHRRRRPRLAEPRGAGAAGGG